MNHAKIAPPGQWTKQLQLDMQFCARQIVKQGSIGQMFVVHAGGGEKHVFSTPWTDDEERTYLLGMIFAYCAAVDAEALTHMGELWFRSVAPRHGETEAEARARAEELRPRDAEDRREAVIVMIMYRDEAGERQVISDTREIERRMSGKVTGLKPYRINTGEDVVFGPVVEAFPQWPPSEEQRLAAQRIVAKAQVRPAWRH